MIAKLSKNRPPRFPRTKIDRAIESILPKGQNHVLRVSDSGIGKMKVVRVVTPAWKRLRPAERIGKVREIVARALPAKDQQIIRKMVLRFSVLTPDEYNKIVLRRLPRGSKK